LMTNFFNFKVALKKEKLWPPGPNRDQLVNLTRLMISIEY
jgi:hypothetical protein